MRMAPAIETHAKIAFRHLRPDERAEAIQDVLCNVCAALARLDELDKLDIAYPSVLARFGVAQVRDGRKVGCHLNIRDVSSPYCQRRKKLTVERLDRFDDEDNQWVEAVIGRSGLTTDFAENCTPGYYNNEGQPGETGRQDGFYFGGPTEFVEILEQWRADGEMKGLQCR